MPYASIEELPMNVRKQLPLYAQEIYMEVFNHALEEYLNEEKAFKVAWAAVKKQYEKSPRGQREIKYQRNKTYAT